MKIETWAVLVTESRPASVTDLRRMQCFLLLLCMKHRKRN